MAIAESILAEYRRADSDKRLNLFLKCPSLRVWFMEIDQSEMAVEYLREPSGDTDTAVRKSR